MILIKNTNFNASSRTPPHNTSQDDIRNCTSTSSTDST